MENANFNFNPGVGAAGGAGSNYYQPPPPPPPTAPTAAPAGAAGEAGTGPGAGVSGIYPKRKIIMVSQALTQAMTQFGLYSKQPAPASASGATTPTLAAMAAANNQMGLNSPAYYPTSQPPYYYQPYQPPQPYTYSPFYPNPGAGPAAARPVTHSSASFRREAFFGGTAATPATPPLQEVTFEESIYDFRFGGVVLYRVSLRRLPLRVTIDQLLDPKLERHLRGIIGLPLKVVQDRYQRGVFIAVRLLPAHSQTAAGATSPAGLRVPSSPPADNQVECLFLSSLEQERLGEAATKAAFASAAAASATSSKNKAATNKTITPGKDQTVFFTFDQMFTALTGYHQRQREARQRNEPAQKTSPSGVGVDSSPVFVAGLSLAGGAGAGASDEEEEAALVYCHLAALKHLLVAGKSGAGKSGFFNQAITSLCTLYGPDDLRLCLIDFKGGGITFAPYKGLPHLLRPPITDLATTLGALAIIQKEAQRRLEYLREAGLGLDIGRHNQMVERLLAEGRVPTGAYEQLPHILVIFDELNEAVEQEREHSARLAEEAGQRFNSAKFQSSIIKLLEGLARQARAAGIYLWLGVQTAHAEVISGPLRTGMNSVLALNFTDNTALAHLLRGSVKNLELAPGAGRGYFQSEGIGSTSPQLVQIAYLSDEEWDRRIRELGASGLALSGPPVMPPPPMPVSPPSSPSLLTLTPTPGAKIKTAPQDEGGPAPGLTRAFAATSHPGEGDAGDSRSGQKKAVEHGLAQPNKPDFASSQIEIDLAQSQASLETGTGTGTEAGGWPQPIPPAPPGVKDGTLPLALATFSAGEAAASSLPATFGARTVGPAAKVSPTLGQAKTAPKDTGKPRRVRPAPSPAPALAATLAAPTATAVGVTGEPALPQALAATTPGLLESHQTQPMSWMAYIEQELKIAPLAVLWLLKWSLTSNGGNFSLAGVVEATRKFNALERAVRQRNWPGCENLLMPGRDKLVRLGTILVEAGVLSEADPKTSTPRRVMASSMAEIKARLATYRLS